MRSIRWVLQKKKDVATCRPAFVRVVGETRVCKCLKFEVPAPVDDVELLMSFEVICFALFR